jgi:hypothetical protein
VESQGMAAYYKTEKYEIGEELYIYSTPNHISNAISPCILIKSSLIVLSFKPV